MELSNDFRVEVGVPEAWKLLTDVERIAPLLPGAQLQEIEGDEYRGVVKVKVGPITAQYKGVATFVEQDEKAGRVVLRASGRDTRGQGNASATITATMVADGDATKVTVVTDLTVTGKVAQFGRGVLADVSSKLMGQFVDALHADLLSGGADASASAASDADAPAAEATDPAETDADEADSPADDGGSGGSAAPAAGSTSTKAAAPARGPRKIDSPEPEPVDLLEAAGGSLAKRAAPAAGGVILVLLFVVLRRRRARRRAQRYAAALAGLRQLRGRVPDVHLPDLHMPDVHLSDLHLNDLHRPDVHLADLQKLARRGR